MAAHPTHGLTMAAFEASQLLAHGTVVMVVVLAVVPRVTSNGGGGTAPPPTELVDPTAEGRRRLAVRRRDVDRKLLFE
eukprot:scaffold40438_cov37-Tisochrysis_lutea.AAC.3